MTVSIHHDIPKTESSENETCYTEDKCSNGDHTESLLYNLKNGDNKKKDVVKLNNNNNDIKKVSVFPDVKYRKLLGFNEAPIYLKHNPYILSGYRGILNTKLCIESIFWWTNETINIWSHIFGFVLFASLTVYDIFTLQIHATVTDTIMVSSVLLCFQICMVLSSMYHTFSCRSEEDCYCFLNYDLFGIALSLLAIYTSGIYFAFWCHQFWRRFYILTVTVIFAVAMGIQLPRFNVNSNVKMIVFVAWAAYGVLPTFHWTFEMGGLDHPVVQILLPRVMGMYAISGTAFLIYLTKTPERFCAGKFDYLGHSHQWWHIIVVFALYYWHNSGVIYANYRLNHACTDIL